MLHNSNKKRYKESIESSSDTDDTNDSSEVFRCERILKSRFKNNRIEYLLKWQGYSERHNSWEPVDNIL